MQELFYLIRRASMDAGLVSRNTAGAFGSAQWRDHSTRGAYEGSQWQAGRRYSGDGLHESSPQRQRVEQLDAEVASSLEVDDLCASSGKLEYLRSLVDSGKAASALKPTVIFVQYRDAADRVAARRQHARLRERAQAADAGGVDLEQRILLGGEGCDDGAHLLGLHRLALDRVLEVLDRLHLMLEVVADVLEFGHQ